MWRMDFMPARQPDEQPIAPIAVCVLNPRASASAYGTGDPTLSATDDSVSDVANDSIDGSPSMPRSWYLFPPDRLNQMLSWPDLRGACPGLSNLGNTCFMNATLQCLTHTAPLANLCLERAHSLRCKTKGFCLYCEFEDHLRTAHDQERPQRSLTPRVLVSHLRTLARHFRPGQQQDAHEYLLCVIDALQTAAVRVASSARGGRLSERIAATSEVQQLFGGQLRSKLVCHTCGQPSLSFEPFNHLSLELDRAPDVEEALRRFSRLEKLVGDNQYRCEACERMVDASKQLQVNTSPCCA